MELRKALAPNLQVASELYPVVKKKILGFIDFWDTHPDEATSKHKEVEEELKNLTGKDMSQFNLWEYWEEDGVENLAFRISLPNPTKVPDFKKSELKEVLTRIKTFEAPTAYKNNEFLMVAWANKADYYRELLKVNFDKYDFKFFIRNKNKAGDYFEYSVEEIVEKLWDR
ncbi:MAG: hypothetical protein ACFB0B_09050 [Thermonemataceae bacterium]